MITEKKNKRDFTSMSLMADDNQNNEYVGRGFKVSQDSLDQINYNNLLDAFTCENTEEVNKYLTALSSANRQDLIDKFNRFRNEFELEKQRKADKVFLDAIGHIVDYSKIDKDVLTYLVNVEKRLQKLEGLFEKSI